MPAAGMSAALDRFPAAGWGLKIINTKDDQSLPPLKRSHSCSSSITWGEALDTHGGASSTHQTIARCRAAGLAGTSRYRSFSFHQELTSSLAEERGAKEFSSLPLLCKDNGGSAPAQPCIKRVEPATFSSTINTAAVQRGRSSAPAYQSLQYHQARLLQHSSSGVSSMQRHSMYGSAQGTLDAGALAATSASRSTATGVSQRRLATSAVAKRNASISPALAFTSGRPVQAYRSISGISRRRSCQTSLPAPLLAISDYLNGIHQGWISMSNGSGGRPASGGGGGGSGGAGGASIACGGSSRNGRCSSGGGYTRGQGSSGGTPKGSTAGVAVLVPVRPPLAAGGSRVSAAPRMTPSQVAFASGDGSRRNPSGRTFAYSCPLNPLPTSCQLSGPKDVISNRESDAIGPAAAAAVDLLVAPAPWPGVVAAAAAAPTSAASRVRSSNPGCDYATHLTAAAAAAGGEEGASAPRASAVPVTDGAAAASCPHITDWVLENGRPSERPEAIAYYEAAAATAPKGSEGARRVCGSVSYSKTGSRTRSTGTQHNITQSGSSSSSSNKGSCRKRKRGLGRGWGVAAGRCAGRVWEAVKDLVTVAFSPLASCSKTPSAHELEVSCT